MKPFRKYWKNAYIHAFFISNTFISNARLKMAKNQAKAKQHLESKLLLFEIIRFLHSFYHPKIIDILRKCTKSNCVCFNEVIWLMAINEAEKEKKGHINTTPIDLGLSKIFFMIKWTSGFLIFMCRNNFEHILYEIAVP